MMLRKRPPKGENPRRAAHPASPPPLARSGPPMTAADAAAMSTSDDPRLPLLGASAAKDGGRDAETRGPEQPPAAQSLPTSPADVPVDDEADTAMDLSKASQRSQWIILAVASGACAAFNGVFAKLTTTELTTTFATGIANLLGLGSGEKVVEVIIRAMFFGLNLIFNGIMWALFTKALARGTSTTQVSIINTSANFMITAVLGFFIFTESLPPLWWLGAGLLVAGNVIIGRRDEEDPENKGTDGVDEVGNGERRYGTEEGEGLLVGESVELGEDLEMRRKALQDEEDILNLDIEDDLEQHVS